MANRILTALLALSLAAAPLSYAHAQSHGQSNGQATCIKGQADCRVNQGAGAKAKADSKTPAKAAKAAASGPKVGGSGKSGARFERQANSRFKSAPKGQEYRVMNDHLVLVDSKTLKMVSVLGLLSALTR